MITKIFEIINFSTMYVVLAIVMSVIIIRGDKVKNVTFSNILFTKGLFYYFIALTAFINYFFFNEDFNRMAIGFTIYIAITEGSTSIKQAIDKIKEKK